MSKLNQHGVSEVIYLPCGGTAYFDHGAGYGYRCEDCSAVLGSIAQPSRCKDAAQKYDNWKAIGGKVEWDYDEGCEKEIA